MIDYSTEELLLTSADFPDDFKNFAHPDDYNVTNRPVTPEYICHSRFGRHNRLIFRISLGRNGSFFSASFVCDTGAPKFLYACPQLLDLLQSLQAIHIDDDTGVAWITIQGKKVPLDPTPQCHAPANIIGLRLLHRLGLCLRENGFSFSTDPACFEL